MAMRTLGEALESALASMLNAGEDGVGAPSDAAKAQRAPGPKPRPVQEVVSRDTALQTQEGEVSRKRRIAPSSPSPVEASPKPAVRRFLVIEGGGRPAGSGGFSRAACAQLPGGNSRSNSLKLVHSAASS